MPSAHDIVSIVIAVVTMSAICALGQVARELWVGWLEQDIATAPPVNPVEPEPAQLPIAPRVTFARVSRTSLSDGSE